MDAMMVTGRMSAEKKRGGGIVLEREGLNASQAINLMYDRLIEEGDASFLRKAPAESLSSRMGRAAHFVDSLSEKRGSRFDEMTKAEIKADRLKARGLM